MTDQQRIADLSRQLEESQAECERLRRLIRDVFDLSVDSRGNDLFPPVLMNRMDDAAAKEPPK